MTKRIIALTLITALSLTGGVALAAVPASAATAATASQTESDIKTILDNTNKLRAAQGLPALTLDPNMSAVAAAGAKTQADAKKIGGDSEASKKVPAGWFSFGQAVAGGYTPANVTNAWMSSATVKGHILSTQHTHTGIGIAYSSTGSPYYTQLFAGYKTAADEVNVSPPTSVKTTKVTTTGFTFGWNAPETVVGTVDKYTVKITGTNYDKTFTTTDRTLTVTDLQPKNSYVVKVTVTASSQNKKFTKSATNTTTLKTIFVPTQADIDRIIADTNAYRAAAGVAPLKQHAGLNTTALNWTKVMAAEKTRYHNPNLRTDLPPGWTYAGENIANGWTVETVTKAWFDSPAHKANLLQPRFTHIGVGLVFDDNGQLFYTQNFAEFK